MATTNKTMKKVALFSFEGYNDDFFGIMPSLSERACKLFASKKKAKGEHYSYKEIVNLNLDEWREDEDLISIIEELG